MQRTILIICPDYKPNRGGLAEQGHQLALALNQAGGRVIVLARKGTPWELDGSFPMEIRRILPTPGPGLLGWVRQGLSVPGLMACLRRLVREEGVSFVLVNSSLHPVTAQAVAALEVPKAIIYVGDEVVRAQGAGFLKRWLMRRVAHSMDLVLCNSRFTAQVARAALGPELEAVVIGCGIDPSQLPPAVDRQQARRQLGLDTQPVLLTVGRLVPRKGVDMVIRAMPKILARVQDALYLVAGSGDDLPRLRFLAAEHGVTEHVRFDGAFEPGLLAQYYCSADAFIMPSRYIPNESVEGFGIVYLEANHYGLPVIGGRAGGVPDAVAEGVSGLLVDPENAGDIAQAAINLLLDHGLRSRLGEGGRKRADEEMTWSVVGARVASAVENVLARQKKL